jgi:hypothetical protein
MVSEVVKKQKEGELTLLQGTVLDMVAEGKSPRQIAEVTGLSATEAAKMAYDLLDKEIVTDTNQRRKLQVYRLEKIVEALWQRVMLNANKDDVKNLIDVLDKLNILLALNKEQDAEMLVKMEQHQLAAYMTAIKALLVAFQMINPDAMTPDEWAIWMGAQLEVAEANMLYEIEE